MLHWKLWWWIYFSNRVQLFHNKLCLVIRNNMQSFWGAGRDIHFEGVPIWKPYFELISWSCHLPEKKSRFSSENAVSIIVPSLPCSVGLVFILGGPEVSHSADLWSSYIYYIFYSETSTLWDLIPGYLNNISLTIWIITYFCSWLKKYPGGATWF